MSGHVLEFFYGFHDEYSLDVVGGGICLEYGVFGKRYEVFLLAVEVEGTCGIFVAFYVYGHFVSAVELLIFTGYIVYEVLVWGFL